MVAVCAPRARSSTGPLARPARLVARAAALAAALAIAPACTNLSGAARPAFTPVGCARAAVKRVERGVRPDKRMHCLVGAEIALLCSPAEARLAAWAKEAGDAVIEGDADAEDARATVAGIDCARRTQDRVEVEECCLARGY